MRRLAPVVVAAFSVLAVGCGTGGTPQAGSGAPGSLVHAWTLTIPASDNLSVVGNRIEASRGGVLYVSPLSAWRPTPVVLPQGASCVYLTEAKGALLCSEGSGGAVTKVFLEVLASGSTTILWAGPQTPMVQRTFVDGQYLVWEGEGPLGTTSAAAYSWSKGALEPLPLPENVGLGLLGSTFTFEIPPSPAGRPSETEQVVLPSSSPTGFGGPLPYLVDPVQQGSWVYAFSGDEAYPSHVWALDLATGASKTFAIPPSLLEGIHFAVGPGYVLSQKGRTYGVYLETSRTWAPLGIPATGSDALGTNGGDVAYIVKGSVLHLVRVTAPAP